MTHYSAFAIALALVASPAPSRTIKSATARSSRNGATARANVRGKTVRVRLRRKGKAQLNVSIHLNQTCHAKKLAELMASEVTANPDAFGVGRDAKVSLWPSGLQGFGVPGRGGRRGNSDDRRGGDEGGGASPGKVPHGFEAMLGDILATGQHGNGQGRGQTCFDGTNFDMTSLIQANAGSVPRGATTIAHADGSSTTTATQAGVKTTWETNSAGKHVTITSSMSPAAGAGSTGGSFGGGGYGSGASISFQESPGTGSHFIEASHEIAHTVQQTSGVGLNSDGSSSSTQELTSGSGNTEVSVKTEKTHDADGKTTSEKTTVTVGGKKAFVHQDKGDKGDKADKADKADAPTLTPEGTFTMPPMCISDQMIGQLINWNRLAEAVTDPSPISDTSDSGATINAPKKLGPCGDNNDDDFDPNPAYLMPNKQGWITDPVPALRGRSRGRGRGR